MFALEAKGASIDNHSRAVKEELTLDRAETCSSTMAVPPNATSARLICCWLQNEGVPPQRDWLAVEFAPFFCNKALLLLLPPQWVRIGGTGKQELF